MRSLVKDGLLFKKKKLNSPSLFCSENALDEMNKFIKSMKEQYIPSKIVDQLLWQIVSSIQDFARTFRPFEFRWKTRFTYIEPNRESGMR